MSVKKAMIDAGHFVGITLGKELLGRGTRNEREGQGRLRAVKLSVNVALQTGMIEPQLEGDRILFNDRVEARLVGLFEMSEPQDPTCWGSERTQQRKHGQTELPTPSRAMWSLNAAGS